MCVVKKEHAASGEERGKGGGDSHQVWVTATLASGVSSSIRGESDRNGMSMPGGVTHAGGDNAADLPVDPELLPMASETKPLHATLSRTLSHHERARLPRYPIYILSKGASAPGASARLLRSESS